MGANPLYEQAVHAFGTLLADAGIRLIYGGGRLGLMGAVAHAAIARGGAVTGIIPDFLLAKEGYPTGAHEQIIVSDMHERKLGMFERADAFVAFPGGIGTLEEIVEMMSWARLGRHNKPILLANINGFWQPLLDLIQHMRQQGFLLPPNDLECLIAERVEDILPLLCRQMSAPRPCPQPLF